MSLKVSGLRELQRDLGKLDKNAKRELAAALRAVAEPVAADVRAKASARGWTQKTVTGIRAGSRLGVAVVRQSRRKTTGDQPHFGALQMKEAFIPAAQQNEAMVERSVELMLDRLTARF